MASIRLFYSYAHQDETFRQELEKHLAILRRQGLISEWHDRRIGPGQAWESEISENLKAADLILLLVSADFLASDYCWDVELRRALEMHRSEEAIVVPVIVRPVDLEGAPFMSLQALPTDAKPISLWPNQDEAWVKVARGIRAACDRITQARSAPSTVGGTTMNSAQGGGDKPPSDPFFDGRTTSAEVLKSVPGERLVSLPPGVLSSELFGWRLSDAFPGIRGVEEICDPVQAADRLEVLLRDPIVVVRRDPDDLDTYHQHPFWWFRGGSNMFIEHFERLGADRVLLDNQELRPRRVVAVRKFSDPARDFLYVEADADEPSGAYTYEPGEIEEMLKEKIDYPRKFGYSLGAFVDEEFGLWNGRPITRAEFDDRAAIIEGRPVLISGAALRARFLTPYNILVCGNYHVINQNEHDSAFQQILDDILLGKSNVDDLIELVRSIRKPIRGRYS